MGPSPTPVSDGVSQHHEVTLYSAVHAADAPLKSPGRTKQRDASQMAKLCVDSFICCGTGLECVLSHKYVAMTMGHEGEEHEVGPMDAYKMGHSIDTPSSSSVPDGRR